MLSSLTVPWVLKVSPAHLRGAVRSSAGDRSTSGVSRQRFIDHESVRRSSETNQLSRSYSGRHAYKQNCQWLGAIGNREPFPEAFRGSPSDTKVRTCSSAPGFFREMSTMFKPQTPYFVPYPLNSSPNV